MKKEKLLIIGFGDLGRRILQTTDIGRYEVHGLCRSDKIMPTSIITHHGDVCDREKMRLILQNNYSVILLTLTPDDINDAGYKRAYVDSVVSLLASLQCSSVKPRLVLFVSSTRVYGQNNGEVVDELSITAPSGFAGPRLLEAEQWLLQSGLPVCVVRFSGIYGRGQPRLLKLLLSKQQLSKDQDNKYTNRIHADDCAGVLVHLMELQKQGNALLPVYLATDSEPATQWQMAQWLQEYLQSQGKLSAFQRGVSAVESLRAHSTGSKYCSNSRLLASGYQFLYPSYRQGYAKVLEDWEKHLAEG